MPKQTTEVEQAQNEDLSRVFAADLSYDQGDSVEIDEAGVPVENLGQLGDKVRDATEATRQVQGENRADGPPVIQCYLQNLFASIMASMKARNVEHASQLKESNKELQSNVEQKLWDSNRHLQRNVEQKIIKTNGELQSPVEQKLRDNN
jgi:hypothetical protein